MKKLLIVMGLVLVLTLAFAGMAFANAGPHGGYDADTAACAACHRAHTAVSADGMLLKATDEYALCTSCHGQGASGTDVIDGTYGGSGTLNGGAFASMGGVNVTSAHNVQGLNGGNGLGTAWGSGMGTNNTDGKGVVGTLKCTSCHNPHGSTNYRILKDGALGHGDTADTIKWVPNEAGLLSPQNNQVLALPGASYTATTARMQAYTNGINLFCANCHEEYLTLSGARSQPSTTTGSSSKYLYPGTQDANDGNGNIARFRHTTSRARDPNSSVRPLRMALLSITSDPASTSSYGLTCLTCHYAHGTTAAASSYAANVQPTNDSALLFYNNRGVCQACHNKQ
ncbi:MAG: hypothetical protein M1319_01695 [Chloroflexi bacterium]|nr:hypothetical protein [Chloroflexota bacterium]